MRRLAAIAIPVLLAGCGGRAACGPTEAVVENASSLAVEQLYLGREGGGPEWGTDLLGQSPALPSPGRMPVTLDGPGPWRLRLVWVNGRASELHGIDGCRTRRITIRDDLVEGS